MFKLDFILIGAPKAGTSSLYNYFLSHPDVSVQYGKEAIDLHSFIESTERQNFFLGNKKFNGIITPDLVIKKNLLFKIIKLYPRIKIIYLVRHPIDRLISHFHHFLSLTNKNININTAIDNNLVLSNYSNETVCCEDLIMQSMYGKILNNLEKKISKKQILVIDIDHKSGFLKICETVCRFLEIKKVIPSKIIKTNVKRNSFLPSIYRLRESKILKLIWKFIPIKKNIKLQFMYVYELSNFRNFFTRKQKNELNEGLSAYHYEKLKDTFVNDLSKNLTTKKFLNDWKFNARNK